MSITITSLLKTVLRAALPLSLWSATSADAALINRDWQVAGDGLIVRDTNTHLEWLKLTQTFGMSYTSVSDQLGSGGMFAGFRYATNTEVVDLFSDYFGMSLSGFYGEVPAFIDPGVRTASETLGDGISLGSDIIAPNANYRLIGFTSDTRLNGNRFVVGARSRWSDTDYFTIQDPVSLFDYASWDPNALITGDAYSHQWVGSFLVRAVAAPLPAAAWLLGAGLVALGGVIRRR